MNKLKIYLDGRLEKETSMKYPEGPLTLAGGVHEEVNFFLGTSIPFDGAFLKVPENRHFAGQIGSSILFSEALTSTNVKDLFDLGFDHVPNFFEREDFLTKAGSPKIQWAYLPHSLSTGKAQIVNLLIFRPPDKKKNIFSSSEHSHFNALLLGNTRIIHQSPFSDSVHCSLGFLSVIATMQFIVMDQLKSIDSEHFPPSWMKDFNHFLHMMGELLWGHPQNCREALKTHCNLSLVSRSISYISFWIDCDTVNELEFILEALLHSLGPNPPSSSVSLKAIYARLLLDFDTWEAAPYPVQVKLLKLLAIHNERHSELFRRDFGVHFFLEIMRRHYSISPSSKHANSQDGSPVLPSQSGRQLKKEQLKIICRGLMKIVEVTIGEVIEPEEIQSIIYFLQASRDSLHVSFVLELLLALLRRQVRYLVYHLDHLGGVKLFWHLLFWTGDKQRSLSVRARAIRDLGKYLQNSNQKAKSKFLSEHMSGIACPEFYLNIRIYRVLSEFLREDFSFGKTENNIQLRQKSRFVNIQILPAIFKCLLYCRHDLPLQETIFTDITHSLDSNELNCLAFLEQPGWQMWLLELLSFHNGQGDIDQESFFQNKIPTLIINLLGKVLVYSILKVKDGWKSIDDIPSCCSCFGNMNWYLLVRKIFVVVILSLEKVIIVQEQNRYNPVWRNLAHFFQTVEGYLFFPSNSLHRNLEGAGKWEDFEMVVRLLGLWDCASGPTTEEHLSSLEAHFFTSILRLTLLTFHEVYQFYGFDSADSDGEDPPSKDPPSKQRNLDMELSDALQRRYSQNSHPIEKLFSQNVHRIKRILYLHVIPSSDPQTSSTWLHPDHIKLLFWVLHYLFKVVKKSCRFDTFYLVIVPLIKEILRRHLSVFDTHLGDECSFQIEPLVCEENSPTDLFIRYLDSQRHDYNYNFDLLEKLSKSKTDVESECHSNLPDRTAREKQISSLKSILRHSTEVASNHRTQLDAKCSTLNHKHSQLEFDRRDALLLKEDEERRQVDSLWRKLKTRFLHDRSCFAPLCPKKMRWKLDSYGNSLGQRKLLKRNWCSVDHRPTLMPNSSDDTELNPQPGLEIIETPEDELNFNPLKTLGEIRITVKKSDNLGSLEEFEFNDPELESTWCLMDDASANPSSNQVTVEESLRIKEKILLTCPSDIVNCSHQIKGKLLITPVALHFVSNSGDFRKRWNLVEMTDVQKRRLKLRECALEVMLGSKAILFEFLPNSRMKVFALLSRLCGGITNYSSLTERLKKSGYTEAWKSHEITNFEYLMHLNTLAGRTYNDLTQYPIFPWVIADYTSKLLDLGNPKVFRDLSKPIGALNPERLSQFLERYTTFDDPEIPSFMYGTHYSSIGSTLYYLVRMEPFASLSLDLQGGKYDLPDRMFHSIPETWNNCLQSMTDVKEVIPEWYYCPEFLLNQNEYGFGVRQDGQKIDDVVLPPWASSADEFIRINRDALESEYVSSHLHEWIDLIFGYKQRGKPAEKAHNVFFYLTYEGSVDFDSIEDPIQRKAIETQISNFGQTPCQILSFPHPQRNKAPLRPSSKQLLWKSAGGGVLTRHFLKCHPVMQLDFVPTDILLGDEEILMFNQSFDSYKARLTLLTDDGDHATTMTFSAVTELKLLPHIKGSLIAPLCLFGFEHSTMAAVLRYDRSSFVIIEGGKVIQTIEQHMDVVTCIKASKKTDSQRLLISASKDTTVCIWYWTQKKGRTTISKHPHHILRGHVEPIHCVELNLSLDLAVSCSSDNSAVISRVSKGTYLRSLYHPKKIPFSRVAFSPDGHIILYSNHDKLLYLWSVNGRLLFVAQAQDRVHIMFTTKDGQFLLTAGDKVLVRSLHNLEIVNTYSTGSSSPITAICLSADESNIFLTLQNKSLLLMHRGDKLGFKA